MNKQEVLKKIEEKKNEVATKQESHSPMSEMFSRFEFQLIAYMNCENFVEQLDEPQKPVVPKFVADWIELCKEKADLISCLSGSYEYGVNQYKRITEDEDWLFEADHQELVARAWLYGYEVEKEPFWMVAVDDGNYYFTKFKHDHNLEDPFQCYSAIEKDAGYHFTDKEMAEAVAKITGGEVIEG